jgi:hypothetical protein
MADILVHNELLGGDRRISRRAFFHTIGLAAVGSVLAAVGIEQLSSTSWTPAAPVLVRSIFAGQVGDTFIAQNGDFAPVALQLFKVRDLRSTRARAAQGQSIDLERSFSILFRGPVDRPLLQESYQLEHERIGRFALFIAPMRAEEDARYYEAIFN